MRGRLRTAKQRGRAIKRDSVRGKITNKRRKEGRKERKKEGNKKKENMIRKKWMKEGR